MKIRTHATARAAYECVAHRRDRDSRNADRYGALAHKLPGMILQHGLAQTTGFLLAKGKTEHRDLFEDLLAVLCAIRVVDDGNVESLHRRVVEADLDVTLVLTRRSLEAAGWLKCYVQGVMGLNSTGDTSAVDASKREGR